MWTAEARQRYAWTRKEGLRLTEPEWALLARISHGLGCIGVSERVNLVLRERVEPGRRTLPDAHTL
jgi:hypothetical protein